MTKQSSEGAVDAGSDPSADPSADPNADPNSGELAALAADLCDRILVAHRAAQTGARDRGRPSELLEVRGQGAGDETFALDEACEAAIDAWFDEHAARGPLSVLTEDRGWRHAGPAAARASAGTAAAGAAATRALDGFDHGGPRIAIDPVDGTRNVAADLRSAWTVVSACGPGAGEPRARDVVHGTVSELPVVRAARGLRLTADAGHGAFVAEFASTLDAPHAVHESARALRVDDDEALFGYLPFFRYDPHMRRAAVELETDVLDALIENENANPRHLFDDQYICSAGQLVLLALGTYRAIVDPRAFLADAAGVAATTSKPYDLTGALLIAREAGCVLAPLDGANRPDADGSASAFDFPLDARTPVGFVGYHNPPTARRVAPHLAHALERAAPSTDAPAHQSPVPQPHQEP